MFSFTFAYGGFEATTYWGMVLETLPRFVGGYIVPGCAVYAASSALADYCRVRLAGVLLYLFVFLCFVAPNLVVMGAYGPAHVAMKVGFWIWPALLLLLVVKTTQSCFGKRFGVPEG